MPRHQVPSHSQPRWRPSRVPASKRVPAFPSMISVRADLAAEHPIGPAGVSENDRHDDDSPDQHEQLALWRSGGVPDRHRTRHDIGVNADPKSDEAEKEESERKEERQP